MALSDPDRATPEQRLAWAAARLRTSGHRYTRPRRLILEVLTRAEGHLTAEAIHHRAATTGSLDPSTVYRTLTILERFGLVHTVPIGGRVTYGLADHPHAHAVCDNCARVTALHGKEWSRLATLAHDQANGFTCNGIIIRGQCHACRPSPAQTTTDPPVR